jgi:pyruvate formate lyase activating enzyme
MMKISRSDCDLCGDCARVCPSGALKIVGEWNSIDEVMEIILKDEPYYRRSNGGLTISGGEPMHQFDFTFELTKNCFTRNINTAIETCGIADWKYYSQINPYTDLYLFDIKHMEGDMHKRLTGVSNKQILANLHKLSEEGKQVILRIPLVPECNVGDENLHQIAEIANDLQIEEVHLMPFHQLGKSKYTHLGRKYTLQNCKDLKDTKTGQSIIQNAKDIMEYAGLTVFIGG